MYRVVRASILAYENLMNYGSARYNIILPYMLLTSLDKYNQAKQAISPEYLNLCDIISEMRSLYETENSQYHHFDMLLKELQILGFDIDRMNAANVTGSDKLADQISLLLQFLAFRYDFDRFDNKTGTHDIKNNKFLFIQP